MTQTVKDNINMTVYEKETTKNSVAMTTCDKDNRMQSNTDRLRQGQ